MALSLNHNNRQSVKCRGSSQWYLSLQSSAMVDFYFGAVCRPRLSQRKCGLRSHCQSAHCCSSSGSSSEVVNTPSLTDTGLTITDEVNAIADDGVIDAVNEVSSEVSTEVVMDEAEATSVVDVNNDAPDVDSSSDTANGTNNATIVDNSNESVVANDAEPAIVEPDSLLPILTNVLFEITVPAYMSDELQLRSQWGDGRPVVTCCQILSVS